MISQRGYKIFGNEEEDRPDPVIALAGRFVVGR